MKGNPNGLFGGRLGQWQKDNNDNTRYYLRVGDEPSTRT